MPVQDYNAALVALLRPFFHHKNDALPVGRVWRLVSPSDPPDIDPVIAARDDGYLDLYFTDTYDDFEIHFKSNDPYYLDYQRGWIYAYLENGYWYEDVLEWWGIEHWFYSTHTEFVYDIGVEGDVEAYNAVYAWGWMSAVWWDNFWGAGIAIPGHVWETDLHTIQQDWENTQKAVNNSSPTTIWTIPNYECISGELLVVGINDVDSADAQYLAKVYFSKNVDQITIATEEKIGAANATISLSSRNIQLQADNATLKLVGTNALYHQRELDRYFMLEATHENNDWSEWTAQSGTKLTITAGSALKGTNFGLNLLCDGTTAQFTYKSHALPPYSDSNTISCRFYIHPNSLVMGDGESFKILEFRRTPFTTAKHYVTLGYTAAAGYYLKFGTYASGAIVESATTVITNAAHYVEVRFISSAILEQDDLGNWWGRGSATLRVDGSLKLGLYDLENYGDVNTTRVYFGAPSGRPVGTSGNLYLDEIVALYEWMSIGA